MPARALGEGAGASPAALGCADSGLASHGGRGRVRHGCHRRPEPRPLPGRSVLRGHARRHLHCGGLDAPLPGARSRGRGRAVDPTGGSRRTVRIRRTSGAEPEPPGRGQPRGRALQAFCSPEASRSQVGGGRGSGNRDGSHQGGMDPPARPRAGRARFRAGTAAQPRHPDSRGLRTPRRRRYPRLVPVISPAGEPNVRKADPCETNC